MPKKKIVICGGGFGGIRVALDLEKKLKDNEEIILINDSLYHTFRADLYEVATAKLEHEKRLDFKNLTGTVNIPLSLIFKNKNVQILNSKIQKIDLISKKVITESSVQNYDYLVLALGATTNYYGIDGAENYSHPLKTTADALNIHNDLKELILRIGKNIKVVIAGGGFTGVELAGELISFLPIQAKVTVIEASSQVLNGMPSWARKIAHQRLKASSVEVLTEHLITKVNQETVFFRKNKSINYDYLIWTAGIKGESLKGKILGAKFTNKDQIAVLPDLSLENFREVFIVGDLAEIKVNNSFIPQTAWAAILEAKLVAKNLYLKLNGQITVPIGPIKNVFVVPLGNKFALGDVYGLKITGFLGWVVKSLIALKYFISILPLKQSIMLWWKGVIIYNKND